MFFVLSGLVTAPACSMEGDEGAAQSAVLSKYSMPKGRNLAVLDHVDPYSGRLEVKIPLGLPGALKDISLYYRRPTRWVAPWSNNTGETNAGGPFGTWTLGWAPTIRMLALHQEAGLEYEESRWMVEHQDGRTEVFYTRPDGSSISATGSRISATSSQGHVQSIVLTDIRGTKYVFGPRYMQVLSDTEFQTIIKSYSDLQSITTLSGDSYTFSSSSVCPSGWGTISHGRKVTIRSASGDVVEINKDQSTEANCAKSATPDITVDVNGIRWLTAKQQIVSDNASIAEVRDAENRATKFSYVWEDETYPHSYWDYSSYVLSQIDLASGGWIKYKYRDKAVQGDPTIEILKGSNYVTSYIFNLADVVERSTSDGLITTFSYNRATGHDDAFPLEHRPRYGELDIVTQRDNTGRVIERGFYGLAYPLVAGRGLETCKYPTSTPYCGYTPAPATGAWKLGLMAYEKNGPSLVENDWGKRLISTMNGWERVSGRIFIEDSAVYVPWLFKRVVTQDGAKFEVSHSTPDQFGYSGITWEVGPTGSKRTTVREISHDTVNNVIGNIKSETITVTTP